MFWKAWKDMFCKKYLNLNSTSDIYCFLAHIRKLQDLQGIVDRGGNCGKIEWRSLLLDLEGNLQMLWRKSKPDHFSVCRPQFWALSCFIQFMEEQIAAAASKCILLDFFLPQCFWFRFAMLPQFQFFLIPQSGKVFTDIARIVISIDIAPTPPWSCLCPQCRAICTDCDLHWHCTGRQTSPWLRLVPHRAALHWASGYYQENPLFFSQKMCLS